MTEEPTKRSQSHLALAGMGVAVTCVAIILWWFVGSAFEQMFRELGGELPMLTRFVMSGWFVIVIAMLSIGLTITAYLKRSPYVFFASYALLGGCAIMFIFAMYLPIFTLAGSISAQ